MIVHHPNDFAVESAPTTYIDLKKETFIDISPIHSSCSNQVLVLPFSQRKCIIPSDKGKSNYRQPECMLECLREEIHKRCYCHPFHLPRAIDEKNKFKDCKAVDIMCFVNSYCKLEYLMFYIWFSSPKNFLHHYVLLILKKKIFF